MYINIYIYIYLQVVIVSPCCLTALPTYHHSSSGNATYVSSISTQHKRHVPCRPKSTEALLNQYLGNIINHRNYQESFFFIPELGQNFSQVQRFLDGNSSSQALGNKEMCGSSTDPFAPIRERLIVIVMPFF